MEVSNYFEMNITRNSKQNVRSHVDFSGLPFSCTKKYISFLLNYNLAINKLTSLYLKIVLKKIFIY